MDIKGNMSIESFNKYYFVTCVIMLCYVILNVANTFWSSQACVNYPFVVKLGECMTYDKEGLCEDKQDVCMIIRHDTTVLEVEIESWWCER